VFVCAACGVVGGGGGVVWVGLVGWVGCVGRAVVETVTPRPPFEREAACSAGGHG
jgi:hypothetical protein